MTKIPNAKMRPEDLRPPIIALRPGKRGVMVSAVESADELSKGLLAGTALGPTAGDVFIDSSLRRATVIASRRVSGSLLDRVRSLFSPRPIRFALTLGALEEISLADAKELVTFALTSSSSVREYWEETSMPVDQRVKQAGSADSFGALCKAVTF